MTKTDCEGVMEVMREVAYKGRNRNTNRTIDLKAKALSPRNANKASELDNILTGCNRARNMTVEGGPAVQDGRRDDANYHVEYHAPGVGEGHDRANS